MFEQTFKNIDDVLWKEAGCTTELDYTEQTSWLLFLKYLDDLEQERALEAELVGKPYEFIIDEAHRWSAWAAPKKPDGTVDHDHAPFGGKERKEVQQNFPIKTGETAFLFLQHFIKILKRGGRAAVVIKNTFLSNSDNASRALRQELLSSCNLHTILDCPSGTFIGAGVKTVVLFFEKGKPFDSVQGTPLFAQGKPLNQGMATGKIWYYQLEPGQNMGKTNSLNDEDLREFVELQARFAKTEKSWLVDIADINRETFDLSVKNPNKAEETLLREPQEILDEIAALDTESAEILDAIAGMVCSE